MKLHRRVERLMAAKEAYYNNTPVMTDSMFDELEEELRVLDKGNDYFKLVGIPIKTQGNKITHKYRMKSMDKGKQPEHAIKWLNKISMVEKDIIILPKVDGVSATIKYNKGKLIYIATRGDGIIGQDITHIAKHLTDIPKTINFTQDEVEIRGEIFLKKNTRYKVTGPLRNAVTGLINRESDTTQTHHLSLVVYQVVNGNFKTVEDSLKVLLSEGFFVVNWDTETWISDYYDKYLASYRESFIYETDGIVLVVNDLTHYTRINNLYKDNDHHFFTNFALKPPSTTKSSIINNITWQMSKSGLLIPVGHFNTVEINGAHISKATLCNYDYVFNMGLRSYDPITVALQNDVIPGIVSNDSLHARDKDRGYDMFIDECPHCQTPLIKKGVHLHCPNKNCKEQLIQKIIYWVKESDTENVAEGTLRTLFNNGVITSIKDLYTVTEDDLQGIEGFKEKKIKTFVQGFQQNKELTPTQLLSKLNIPLVRTKALTKMKISTIMDFRKFNNSGSAIGRNVIEWKAIEGNLELLDELLTVITLREEAVKGNALGVVCMTGKSDVPRKQLTEIINTRGYEVSSSVTKSTTILLTDDTTGGSSKLVKARKLGVEIREYKEFLNE